MPRVYTFPDLCCIAPSSTTISRDATTGCLSESVHTYSFAVVTTTFTEDIFNNTFTTTIEVTDV